MDAQDLLPRPASDTPEMGSSVECGTCDDDPDHAPLEQLRAAFGVEGVPVRLAGGSVSVSRFGDLVCKRIHGGSLEHPSSLALTEWLGGVLHALPSGGFRVARPVPTGDGKW